MQCVFSMYKSAKFIDAINVVVFIHGCSKSEAKRLLKQGAVALAEDSNAEFKKIKEWQWFRIVEDEGE